MDTLARWCLAAAKVVLASMVLLAPAWADVWGYIDERGVAHFANEKLDARYELFYKGGESFDTTRTPPVQPDAPATAGPVHVVPARLQTFFEVSPGFKAVRPHIREAANAFKVDFELIQALIAAESGYDAQAVSPKGAMGLMQLMPQTAKRYGVDGDRRRSQEQKLFDPKINIQAGTRYLRDLIHMFPGQLELAIASYNAGEGAVQRAGNRIPNFKETQAYVKTVMQLYQGLKPPAAVVTERQRMPTRVRVEMLGGATGRANMVPGLSTHSPLAQPDARGHLLPLGPSSLLPRGSQAAAESFPNTLPGADLSQPLPGALR
jgi:Transglycosylase SLT domain